MNILTVGDSFTYGEELDDLYNAWPYKLGNRIRNSSVVNLGEPAASNDKILRKTIEYVLVNNVDLVVIGWSNLGRSEFADEFGYYDVWPGYSGNLFLNDGSLWRKELVDYVSKYHCSKAIHKKFLQTVLLLQGFLDSRKIKYVMCNIVQNEYYKKTHFDGLEDYNEQINRERFLGFNEAGMCEWAHGCKKGPGGHFLEDGHQIIADKINEHIRNLGWLS
jgi:lysophospholipase L1-like esterase